MKFESLNGKLFQKLPSDEIRKIIGGTDTVPTAVITGSKDCPCAPGHPDPPEPDDLGDVA